ncbi:ATP-binding cassette domain-containing protein [Pseudomonas fragariae (ex Marin et al. 2024)]|uniref:ATP-binding cassette domain-containing protein n=2 Tax=Pseudomonas fragariae (ex Marin et al. 2024) TaxID=3080056 RepID=A0ABU5B8Q7_9PSED|nr:MULTISPECIES: ATP-binding cassette domain-containing protein [unclassified Pseudomonas]MCW6057811.1 ATP-binding cassette domain-containing protein [Pseudomonas fragi]MDV0427896.1 ATP-binding cassette domain-containing protein [Pseudomonas sp. 17]MDX9573683.1 ATP-binding cassette domain-containing protein [Pseudomonas sp. 21(2023)]MDX9587944.1 ATP-binding cassette domain-containing protein [Pseudomonas sp. 19(2023)]MDX9624990.1 ATP-binding cassette domain-containing protein [Pseudomonas sp. 
MIRLQSLTLQRGPQRLLEDAELTLHAGHKAGLIGANGAGKSSLFALLRGELTPDAGDCLLPADWRIAHMRQEVDTLERLAVDYVLDGDERLREVQSSLAEAEAAQDGAAQARLHSELDSADGYTADARARKLLAGLGFTNEQMERQVGSFSGGWRMRLNLAQALMCPSDLLLLDEPTNHLDLDAILWLEDWLKSYPGTLLLISHDRDFLDAVVDHIAHVEQRRITLYRGGYSAFERARAERLAQQQQAYEKQQAQRAHMEKYIARFKAQATKARQAQSRIKALERMEELSAAHVDSPFNFVFRESDKISSPLLDLSDARLGYGDKTILEKVKLQLTPGARIGLLGPNGAGKSTLIKNLAGELEPQSGRLVRGENLTVGYFAQHQLDSLDAKATPLLHLQRLAPTEREQTLRDFLGGFDFRGARLDEPVLNFSGGEKARLALALIAWEKPNLLLLDEPTNHLDLEMRLALTMALQEFGGAVLVVSHDRHLLKSTTDDFLLVADGRVQAFDGDLDDYTRWLADYRLRNAPVSKTPVNADKTDKKAQRQQAAALRQQLAPHKREADKLERDLGLVNEKLAKVEEALADSTNYEAANKDKLRDLLAEQAKLKVREAELEDAWMQALELLESMQAELEALS